jgi:hypothetical protein
MRSPPGCEEKLGHPAKVGPSGHSTPPAVTHTPIPPLYNHRSTISLTPMHRLAGWLHKSYDLRALVFIQSLNQRQTCLLTSHSFVFPSSVIYSYPSMIRGPLYECSLLSTPSIPSYAPPTIENMNLFRAACAFLFPCPAALCLCCTVQIQRR